VRGWWRGEKPRPFLIVATGFLKKTRKGKTANKEVKDGGAQLGVVLVSKERCRGSKGSCLLRCGGGLWWPARWLVLFLP
jgi:hypothetical protein